MLYSPDNDSGTFEFFIEAILGKADASATDVQQSSDDNILVNGVANDPDGLGYFGYAYYAANKDRLAGRGGPERPRRQAGRCRARRPSLDKSYAPLSRPLYIFVKNSAAAAAEVAKFLKYYLDNVASSPRRGATSRRRPRTRPPTQALEARPAGPRRGDARGGRGELTRTTRDRRRGSARTRHRHVSAPGQRPGRSRLETAPSADRPSRDDPLWAGHSRFLGLPRGRSSACLWGSARGLGADDGRDRRGPQRPDGRVLPCTPRSAWPTSCWGRR